MARLLRPVEQRGQDVDLDDAGGHELLRAAVGGIHAGGQVVDGDRDLAVVLMGQWGHGCRQGLLRLYYLAPGRGGRLLGTRSAAVRVSVVLAQPAHKLRSVSATRLALAACRRMVSNVANRTEDLIALTEKWRTRPSLREGLPGSSAKLRWPKLPGALSWQVISARPHRRVTTLSRRWRTGRARPVQGHTPHDGLIFHSPPRDTQLMPRPPRRLLLPAAMLELAGLLEGAEIVRQWRRGANRSLVASGSDRDPASVRLLALTWSPSGIAALAEAAWLPRARRRPQMGQALPGGRDSGNRYRHRPAAMGEANPGPVLRGPRAGPARPDRREHRPVPLAAPSFLRRPVAGNDRHRAGDRKRREHGDLRARAAHRHNRAHHRRRTRAHRQPAGLSRLHSKPAEAYSAHLVRAPGLNANAPAGVLCSSMPRPASPMQAQARAPAFAAHLWTAASQTGRPDDAEAVGGQRGQGHGPIRGKSGNRQPGEADRRGGHAEQENHAPPSPPVTRARREAGAWAVQPA